MRETAYAFCKDSKCLYETYTKEKEDALFKEVNNSLGTKQKKIISGTELPTEGNDGDIFLLYEE
jgi:hypothetical protein